MVLRKWLGLAIAKCVVEPFQLGVEVGNGEARIRSPECLINEVKKLTYGEAIEPEACARHSR